MRGKLHLPASSFVLIYSTRRGKEGQSTRRIKTNKRRRKNCLRLCRSIERLFAVGAGESAVPSVGVELIASTGVCVRSKLE